MAASSTLAKEQVLFRRQFPRRDFSRLVGLLIGGKFLTVMASEIGEGGMSVFGEASWNEGQHVVLSFQIPGGDLISVRSVIRSNRNNEGRLTIGLSFETIEFAHKRQIRVFVSSRASEEGAV